MKTLVVLAVGIVLVSILFCPVVMAAPGMPDGLQIVQPEPSLPKELSAFFGKWEGSATNVEYFLIVEKIDEEKASLWIWRSVSGGDTPRGWENTEAKVFKDRGKYTLWYMMRWGKVFLTLKGEYLDFSSGLRLRRVP
jgi:hypothetical protein